jgi:hypothetical protein
VEHGTRIDYQHLCGSVTIAGGTFALVDRPMCGAAYRRADLIATSPPGAVPYESCVVVYLDSDGVVTLIARGPDYLIDSPSLWARLRDTAIAISMPAALLHLAGCRVGDQLLVSMPRV